MKVKCIVAARFAFLDAPILDINEVTQVPMLSPYNIGNAELNGINPSEANAINIPIEADELCIIPVIKNPATMPNNGWFPK